MDDRGTEGEGEMIRDGSPGSNSRRKGKPSPLVLTPPRQKVYGVPHPRDEISIITNQPSPTEALNHKAGKSNSTPGNNDLSKNRPSMIAGPSKQKGKLPVTMQAEDEDEEEEYSNVEPGYIMPPWLHGTDNFLRIGGSAAVSSSQYSLPVTASENDDSYGLGSFNGEGDDGNGDRVKGSRYKPSLSRSPDREWEISPALGSGESDEMTPKIYDQGEALHNILLTPTYIPTTPSSGEGRRRFINPSNPTTTNPFKRYSKSTNTSTTNESDKRARRTTLLDRATNLLNHKRLNFIAPVGFGETSRYPTTLSTPTPPVPSSATRRNAMEMGTLYNYKPTDRGDASKGKRGGNLGVRERYGKEAWGAPEGWKIVPEKGWKLRRKERVEGDQKKKMKQVHVS